MKRTRTVGTLLVGLLVALGATTAAARTPASDLLNVQEHTLDNGMRLLMIEDHSAPVVSYQVYYHVGSRHERPGITGMAHQFEHMMFRGSEKYGPEEHAQIVKAHGGRLNASTSYDRTAYYENISSEYLELIVHLEAERQANLRINEESFLPENQVVQEERRMRVDNSLFGNALEELITNAYRAHPYSWPIIGWMSDLQSFRMEDLKWFHKTFYAPNNATAIIAGDFDPAEAIEIVERYHGPIPSQPLPPQPPTEEPPQRGERRVELHRPAQLPFLFAAYHIPAAKHEDIPALEIAQKILADGESSRIYRRCVYDTQVARFAGGFLYDLKDPGLFIAYIGVNQGKGMDEAETELFGVIDSLAAHGPSERELQKAVNQLTADYYNSVQTVYGKAAKVGEAVIAYDGDYARVTDKLEEYPKVTAEDVQRVVGTYLRPLNRTTLILVPDDEAAPVDLTDAGGDQ